MRQETHAEIRIDDFHPRQDGFVQSYKGTWKEEGMIATAWLDTVEPDHFPPGLYLRNAYELSSTFERALGGLPRGARQEETGAELSRKLRERMKTEMRAAGWQVVAHTKEGKEIWQYQPARTQVRTETADVHAAENVTPTQVLVTRTARPVSFICEVCQTPTTQLRFPGPKPHYCSDRCKQEGLREKSRQRMARLRKRRRTQQEAP